MNRNVGAQWGTDPEPRPTYGTGEPPSDARMERLRHRVSMLHALTGESMDVEHQWFRWIQLIDAFNIEYAERLMDGLEEPLLRGEVSVDDYSGRRSGHS